MVRKKIFNKASSASNFNNTPKGVVRNLANYVTPVQLERLRTDVSMWRRAIAEAEFAYFPYRVKMQRMFIDSVLNGHAYSVMERRKDLTLLRDYSICDAAYNESKVLTDQLKESPWFTNFQSYSLDAIFYGYSLISLGDIVDSELQGCGIIPRWFVSPDRYQVTSFIYATAGKDWREDPQKDWHIYVPTASDSGVSPCGYGLLYQVAIYEIFLRNTLGYNGDFVELYSMPYRVGKTEKTDALERAQFEQAVQSMGSAGYAIVDPLDDIQFLESKLGGTGWQGYDNLEKRCEAKVSKLILGHADAMDSTPGKLGAGQDGTESPVAKALRDKQVKDGRFMEPIINKQLFPRLQKLGIFELPAGYRFVYKNDEEREAYRRRQDSSNKVTAEIAKTMKDAGMKMSAKYFQDRTGIETEEAPDGNNTDAEEVEAEEDQEVTNSIQNIQNKLKGLYSK